QAVVLRSSSNVPFLPYYFASTTRNHSFNSLLNYRLNLFYVTTVKMNTNYSHSLDERALGRFSIFFLMDIDFASNECTSFNVTSLTSSVEKIDKMSLTH